MITSVINMSNKMYYIVYILEYGAYTIIPENWIKNFALHKEKFLNNSINSAQVHVCYWTPLLEARFPTGDIKFDFPPNFNYNLDTQFPAEGNYLCKIIKAKADFGEAWNRVSRKRKAPPIYNSNRLFERPLPKIPVQTPVSHQQTNHTDMGKSQITPQKSGKKFEQVTKRTKGNCK